MTDLVALKSANAHRWATATPTRNFASIARELIAPDAKARYRAVEALTGVPWAFIAVAHEREASQNWNTHLAQGDPLHEVTRHVPIGEPAFASWEDGAVDALVHCPPHAALNKDWSIGGTLTMLEEYNGLKYASYNRPSPYIWSGMSCYTTGKVLVDHGPIVEVADIQLGCAGLLRAMMAIDPTITFAGAVPAAPTVHPQTIAEPRPLSDDAAFDAAAAASQEADK